jgi:CelD/BcsL family acetyltransferase involved in cellulose biosynthesis
MKISNQALHDLTGAATRLTAVVSLLRDPEARADLDPATTHRDVLAALDSFREIWLQETKQEQTGG